MAETLGVRHVNSSDTKLVYLDQQHIPLQMHPVTEDIECHRDLEEEHVGGIQMTQGCTQTHCGDAVCQLIHHGAKTTS